MSTWLFGRKSVDSAHISNLCSPYPPALLSCLQLARQQASSEFKPTGGDACFWDTHFVSSCIFSCAHCWNLLAHPEELCQRQGTPFKPRTTFTSAKLCGANMPLADSTRGRNRQNNKCTFYLCATGQFLHIINLIPPCPPSRKERCMIRVQIHICARRKHLRYVWEEFWGPKWETWQVAFVPQAWGSPLMIFNVSVL